MPDLFGFIGPKSLFLEAKTGGATLSAEQEKFRSICRQNGVAHIIGRTVEQVIAEIGVLDRALGRKGHP